MQENYRGVLTARLPGGDERATVIVTRQGLGLSARTWLTFAGSIRSTAVLTNDEVDELHLLLTAARETRHDRDGRVAMPDGGRAVAWPQIGQPIPSAASREPAARTTSGTPMTARRSVDVGAVPLDFLAHAVSSADSGADEFVARCGHPMSTAAGLDKRPRASLCRACTLAVVPIDLGGWGGPP